MERKTPRGSWTEFLLPVALILGLALLLSLDLAAPGGETVLDSPLEAWLKPLMGYLAAGTELAAALVIGVAVARSILDYVRQLFGRSKQEDLESIRLRLGRALVLGLEFTVAGDILRTAVAPTRQDILNLGAIVLLRTLLNYFLEREIRLGEETRQSQEQPEENNRQ